MITATRTTRPWRCAGDGLDDPGGAPAAPSVPQRASPIRPGRERAPAGPAIVDVGPVRRRDGQAGVGERAGGRTLLVVRAVLGNDHRGRPAAATSARAPSPAWVTTTSAAHSAGHGSSDQAPGPRRCQSQSGVAAAAAATSGRSDAGAAAALEHEDAPPAPGRRGRGRPANRERPRRGGSGRPGVQVAVHAAQTGGPGREDRVGERVAQLVGRVGAVAGSAITTIGTPIARAEGGDLDGDVHDQGSGVRGVDPPRDPRHPGGQACVVQRCPVQAAVRVGIPRVAAVVALEFDPWPGDRRAGAARTTRSPRDRARRRCTSRCGGGRARRGGRSSRSCGVVPTVARTGSRRRRSWRPGSSGGGAGPGAGARQRARARRRRRGRTSSASTSTPHSGSSTSSTPPRSKAATGVPHASDSATTRP